MLSITLSLFLGALMLSSPMMTSIYIILLSIFISLLMVVSVHSWFAFLLFLLYVGGMLVIFMYFSSLIPNQKMNTQMFFTVAILASIFYGLTPSLTTWVSNPSWFSQEPLLIISPVFSLVYLSIVLFLFIVMVTVVKLTSKPQLPMRPLMYAHTCP